MPDREKVKKGLECCLVSDEDYSCDKCPYRATEDERKVIDWRCHLEELRSDVLELLREQEPVPPWSRIEVTPEGTSFVIDCGACKTELARVQRGVPLKDVQENVKYCIRCGKAMKWDD